MIENIYEKIIAESKKIEDNHQARRDAQTRAWFETHPECRNVVRLDDNEEPMYLGKPEKAIRAKEEIDVEKRIGAEWWTRIGAGHVHIDHFGMQRKTDGHTLVRAESDYGFRSDIRITPNVTKYKGKYLKIAADEDWVAEDKVIADKKKKLTRDIQLVLEM